MSEEKDWFDASSGDDREEMIIAFANAMYESNPQISVSEALKHVGVDPGGVEYTRGGANWNKSCKKVAVDNARKVGLLPQDKKKGGKEKGRCGRRGVDVNTEILDAVRAVIKEESLIYDSIAGEFYRARKSYFHLISGAEVERLIHAKIQTLTVTHMATAMSMARREAGRSVELDDSIPGSEKKKLQKMTYMDAMDNMYMDLIRFQGSPSGDPVMFDVRRDMVLPVDDTYCSRVELPYAYDGDAVPGDEWFMFLEDITLGEKQMQMLIQEMFGYCLTNETSFQKAFILLGDHGSNGKGVLMSILKAVVGRHNCSGLAMDQFAKSSNFTSLIGKKVNIDDDLEKCPGVQTVVANFKKLTGEGDVEVDPKFKPAYKFRNFAKLIFLANDLPYGASEEAYFRRFLYMKFDMRAVDNPVEPHERKKIRKLDEKLMKYLPGIFNWAMEGLKRLMKNGEFTECYSAEETMLSHKIQNSISLAFAEEVLSKGSDMLVDPSSEVSHIVQVSSLRDDVFVERTVWYSIFKEWVKEEKPAVRTCLSKKDFEKALKGHYGRRVEIKGSRMKISNKK